MRGLLRLKLIRRPYAYVTAAVDPSPNMSQKLQDEITDQNIEDSVFALLSARLAASTICPSEVARALRPNEGAWRELMPEIRRVAKQLVAQGSLRVSRRGVDVDADDGRGPIRLGLPIRPGGPPAA